MIPIKKWADEDRPREKLVAKGRQTLTDAELFAILIQNGTKNRSALEVAKDLLRSANNNLNALSEKTLNELKKTSGIGQAKAITVIAALEIGRRKKDQVTDKKTAINSSKDIYELMQATFCDLDHEEFWIVLLNRANKVVSTQQISRGGVSGTVADPKLIFKSALHATASAIVLCHNHPSGNLKASDPDRELTKRLIEAGILLDIKVLDHVIFGEKGYFSFADEGLMIAG